jgi:hypothetical protein
MGRGRFLCACASTQEDNPSRWQAVCGGLCCGRAVSLDACQHLPLLMVASDNGCVQLAVQLCRTAAAILHATQREQLNSY